MKIIIFLPPPIKSEHNVLRDSRITLQLNICLAVNQRMGEHWLLKAGGSLIQGHLISF